MDKYELVLEIIEHPDRFSSTRLTEILSDPETREIYNLLCKTESALKVGGKDNNATRKDAEAEIEEEWRAFSNKYSLTQESEDWQEEPETKKSSLWRRLPLWLGNRAAVISIVVLTSLVAVAGIALTVTRLSQKPKAIEESSSEAVMPSETLLADTVTAPVDTVPVDLTPVVFEDEPLGIIMERIAAVYNVEVKTENSEAAALHLFYKFDPALPLDEILEQLNNFEQIDIRRNGNILTIH